MRRLVLSSVVVVSGTLLMPLAATAAASSARIANCPPAIGCFNPNPIRVALGDTVTWTNNTGVTHTATSDTGAWDTGNVAPAGTSGAITFNSAGTFTYHCAIHASMTGSVIVSAAATTATSPPVRGLASGGGGPRLPIAAVLLLLGSALLAARRVRGQRQHRVGKGVDKLPDQ